ncbi:hypothetical protein M5689_009353 [Euphorbia peplus]|nr:hypothetical protein M5689_009353 [Euphorbia peplus]
MRRHRVLSCSMKPTFCNGGRCFYDSHQLHHCAPWTSYSRCFIKCVMCMVSGAPCPMSHHEAFNNYALDSEAIEVALFYASVMEK